MENNKEEELEELLFRLRLATLQHNFNCIYKILLLFFFLEMSHGEGENRAKLTEFQNRIQKKNSRALVFASPKGRPGVP